MKRILALILALLFVLASAMAESAIVPAWIDSSIEGAIDANTVTDPRDDFYLHVNKDWLASTEIKPGRNSVSNTSLRSDEVQEQTLALLNSDAPLGEAGEKARTLYQMLMDYDKRNALGMTELASFVKRIEGIDSMDALNAYLLKDDVLYNSLMNVFVSSDMRDNSVYTVYIEPQSLLLSDAAEYRMPTNVGKRAREAYTPFLTDMLLRCGYDKERALKVVDDAFAYETMLAKECFGYADKYRPDYEELTYNKVSSADLAALSDSFPICEIVAKYMANGNDSFILTEPKWLKKLNKVYVSDNLELIKAYLIAHTLDIGAGYADEECIKLIDAYNSKVSGRASYKEKEERAYNACSDLLVMAVGHMYADAYVTDAMRNDITEMINSIVDVYKARLNDLDWLGEATKEKAVRKLEKLRVFACAPKDWSFTDYSELEIVPYEAGGTLLSNYIAIKRLAVAYEIKLLGTVNENTDWTISPNTVNAFCDPAANAIYILAGYLGGIVYDSNARFEQNLGGAGIVIGHELTHLFDVLGSQFDENGNMLSWWTEKDKTEFEKRSKAVADYYGAIEVLPGLKQSGELTLGEAVADLGAMSCALEIAKNVPDFDYELFFSSFARTRRTKLTREAEEAYILDEHPVSYKRVNALVQQFEEFYETFDVKEGDGMYLAPEYRLKVW